MFPAPSEVERAQISDIVAGLVAFLYGVVVASTGVTATVPVRVTGRTRRSLKQRLSRKVGGRTHWELIADLAWLASGRQGNPCSERTVRRYLEGQHRSRRSPAFFYWPSNWELFDRRTPSLRVQASRIGS